MQFVVAKPVDYRINGLVDDWKTPYGRIPLVHAFINPPIH